MESAKEGDPSQNGAVRAEVVEVFLPISLPDFGPACAATRQSSSAFRFGCLECPFYGGHRFDFLGT